MNSSQQRMRLMVDDVGFGEIYGFNSATRFTKEVLDILKFSFQHSSGAVPVQMFSHHESVRPGLYQHVRMLRFKHLCFIRFNLRHELFRFRNKAARMASFCFAWWIFHIISNPFNCSDTAKRVAKAMIGVKEITRLCFAIYFCFSNFAPKLVPRIFGLFSSRKPGFPIRTQGEIRPGKRASPVNRAHTKRPKVLTTGASVTWHNIFLDLRKFFGFGKILGLRGIFYSWKLFMDLWIKPGLEIDFSVWQTFQKRFVQKISILNISSDLQNIFGLSLFGLRSFSNQ